MPRYCCTKFEEGAQDTIDYVGGGFLFPTRSTLPPTRFDFNNDSKLWSINGCCGSCYVVQEMQFCPYCGTLIPDSAR